MTKKTALALSFAATFALAGCQRDSTTTYSVGIQKLRIPDAYLESEVVPWLPSSQDEAPLLVLNPRDRSQDRISLLIEPAAEACGSHGNWVHICRPESALKPLRPADVAQITKVADEGSVTWRYVSNTLERSGSRLIAVCNATTADPERGLCEHLYRRGDLVLTVRLREDQLAALPAIQRNLNRALARWQEN